MKKQTERYIDDSRIQGLVETKRANFSACMEAGCFRVRECSSVKIKDIDCIHTKPLLQISNSKFDLHTETKNKVKAFFERLVLRYKNPHTFHNATNQTFLDNLAKYLADESTPDLSAQYIAFSSKFSAPSKNSILELELGRVATTPTRSGAAVTAEASFGLTDANTLSTTVDTVVDASQFSILDVTGLSIGDRVQVKVGGTAFLPTAVTAISGTLVTVDPPLSTLPVNGDTFEQMISRVQLVAGSATATLNSGDPVSIAPYIDTKSSTETLDVTFTVTFV